MLLALLVLPILTASANPFHKYPYVFLLDVGNEELEKVNTEQIRLSSPGGSVALRYPAVGNGDDIAHLRVSGIDFGTDLKANIVDGGPGYKYVVIVLMGKPGVTYDAVITLQTVPDIVRDDSFQTIDDRSSGNANDDIPNDNQENDPNTSAEDLKDYEESEGQVEVNEKNGEITQESSNVYSYTQNEALSGYGSSHNYEGSEKDGNDDESEGNDSIYKSYQDQSVNVEAEDYDPRDDTRINEPSDERNTDDVNSQSDSNQPVIVDQDLYNKYIALKEHIYDGSEVYSQGRIEQSDPAYSIDQNYDDRLVDDYEEINSGKDSDADNYIDTDEASAVDQ